MSAATGCFDCGVRFGPDFLRYRVVGDARDFCHECRQGRDSVAVVRGDAALLAEYQDGPKQAVAGREIARRIRAGTWTLGSGSPAVRS